MRQGSALHRVVTIARFYRTDGELDAVGDVAWAEARELGELGVPDIAEASLVVRFLLSAARAEPVEGTRGDFLRPRATELTTRSSFRSPLSWFRAMDDPG
jgi:hypothetical protein